MTVFKIGVRELVEFTLRSGDLNAKLNSNNTAKQGRQIHRAIQRKRGRHFEAEYALKHQFKFEHHQLLVHGRADGIIFNATPVIEEIKTSDVEWSQLPANIKTLYWGQVKVYAALLMLQKPSIKKIKLRLTYVQTPDQIHTTEEQTITNPQATAFLNELLTEYQEWLQLRAQIKATTVKSAHHMTFPFPQYRPYQKKLAQVVYKTIYTHQQLMLEAPTGTGKTISTLFPALKAVGEDLLQRCYYLTAKQSTRHVAEETLDLLSQHGWQGNSITITAKEQITFAKARDLAPEKNPYMVGYYDRVKPALKDALTHHHQFTRQVIEQYAEQYQLDPFTFSLDLSDFCTVIICDYNYLFDPLIQLERFASLSSSEQCYLIDEVHNLVDRSREMYSTDLSNSLLNDIIATIETAPTGKKRLLRSLQELASGFQDAQGIIDEQRPDDHQVSLRAPLKPFNQTVQKLTRQLHRWFSKHDEETSLNEQLLTIYFATIKWLRISELYDDERYRTRIIEDADHTNITVKQFCIDPSPSLAESLKNAGSAILFSATLSPMSYYQRTLGNQKALLKYRVPSPFPKQNQALITTPFINTTYRQRQASLPNIINTIHAMITAHPGHYIIFLPSFAYLAQVSQAFAAAFPQVSTVIQINPMTAVQRQAFIEQFKTTVDESLVGFAILGGLFSEGIDLTNQQLVGVGIVSVGLPGLNPETNLVAEYFDQVDHHGFEYAYQIPGWNHVVQAAGRLIRTANDRGIIVLMDARFEQRRYQTLFPEQWQPHVVAHQVNEVQTAIQHFWQSHHDK